MEQLDLHIFILTQQIQFKALCQFLWDLGDKRLVLYSIWLDPGTLTRKLRNRRHDRNAYGQMYRQAGARLAMSALIERHQMHSNLELQQL